MLGDQHGLAAGGRLKAEEADLVLGKVNGPSEAHAPPRSRQRLSGRARPPLSRLTLAASAARQKGFDQVARHVLRRLRHRPLRRKGQNVSTLLACSRDFDATPGSLRASSVLEWTRASSRCGLGDDRPTTRSFRGSGRISADAHSPQSIRPLAGAPLPKAIVDFPAWFYP